MIVRNHIGSPDRWDGRMGRMDGRNKVLHLFWDGETQFYSLTGAEKVEGD
jgi:hypothetical protein